MLAHLGATAISWSTLWLPYGIWKPTALAAPPMSHREEVVCFNGATNKLGADASNLITRETTKTPASRYHYYILSNDAIKISTT